MNGIIEFLKSPKGRPVAIVFGLLAAVAAVYMVWSSIGPNEAVASSTDRIFICSETGKTFRRTLAIGDTVPVPSPHSGKNTGYEPELCYWTKDGKVKEDPTYVLLNQTAGRPGPTFCPDCSRLVVGLNPPAAPGMTPPPTKAEFDARPRRSGGGGE